MSNSQEEKSASQSPVQTEKVRGWLGRLPPDVRDVLAAKLVVREFDAGEYIFIQGEKADGIYEILTGQAQLIGTGEDGQTTIFSVPRPGESLGFLCIWDDKPNPFSLVATMPTKVAFLHRTVTRQVAESHPEILPHLSGSITNALRTIYHFLINTNGRPPVRVVAQRILDLAGGVYPPDTTRVAELEAMSQDEIGAATYLTRPTVNRALKELEAKGAVELGYGRVRLTNAEMIALVASGSTGEASAIIEDPRPESCWKIGTPIEPTAKLISVIENGGWLPLLPTEIREDLITAMQFRSFGAGEYLYQAGEDSIGLYVMVSGQANFCGESRDGHTLLMNLLLPGEWTGFPPVLDGAAQALSVQVTRKSVFGLVPNDVIRRTFFGDFDRYRHLMQPSAMMLRYLYDFLIRTNRSSPARLVAARLYDLLRSAYHVEMGPRDYIEHLTQQDIARATGLSRPTVNRVLRELDDLRIISLGYGRATILDVEALKAFARDKSR